VGGLRQTYTKAYSSTLLKGKIDMPYFSVRYMTGLLLLILASLMLSACNSGGGDTASGTGSVAFLITDGPAADFDEINVSVNRAELFCDSGHVTVFEGDKTFNLLDLADNGRIFAAGDNIPAGSCSKIRLTLSQIELIHEDDAGNTLKDYPQLPGNGKLDLVPRGGFYIGPGQTVLIQIDMDANKSIHIVETGSDKYQFRPVVFVNVIGGQFPGKFLHVHGVIGDVNYTVQKFSLCQSAVAPAQTQDLDYEGCIDVAVTDATSIFNQAGEPVVDFNQLVSGDEATVYGRLRRDDDNEDVTPQNEYAEGLDDLELAAYLVELGPESNFQRYSGTTETAVNAGQFSLLTDPALNTRVTVQIYTKTKIISRQGEMLTTDDIALGVPMMVEGVMVDSNTVSAAFIVLDLDGMYLQKLSGIVNDNPADACGGPGLNMNDGVMDRDVQFSDDTRAFLVGTESGGGFITEEIMPDAIPPGQSIDVYGTEGTDGCFDAETIIAFE
jgi:hypothetical protein